MAELELELDLAEIISLFDQDMRVLGGLLAKGLHADRVRMGPDKRLQAVVWDPADNPRRDSIICGDRCWQTPGLLSTVLTMVRGEPLYTAFTRDWDQEHRVTRSCQWICWGVHRILKCDSHNTQVGFDREKGVTITYLRQTATFPLADFLDLIDKTIAQ